MERVRWIDFLRGICMITILIFHTEVYYKEYEVTPYYIYTTNAIILFYFISGYLFYRQQNFNLKRKLYSILRSMLIPYFIFTTILSVPKAFLHQEIIEWKDIIIHIVCGRASWFIAALIVAEILFSLFLYIYHGKHKWLLITAFVCFITYFIIPFNKYNLWQWQDALLAIIFIYAGYSYHQFQKYMVYDKKPVYLVVLTILLIIIKLYEYQLDLPMRNIAIENIPLFLIDTIIFLLLIISLIRFIPSCKPIEWTGQYCIVYYFLCGGCPLIVSFAFNKISLTYDGYLYRFFLATFSVYLLATCLTWFIYKYISFLTGRRRI